MKAKLLFLLSFAVGLSSWAQAQVRGTVKDKASGDPLPGVTVIVEGKTKGVFSDGNGAFSIAADASKDVLIFSFVGYNNVRLPLNGATSVQVSMESGVALDEVVVTALGVSREKKALGYAVQELGGDAFTEARADNIVRSLTGKIAGVQVTSGTSMPARRRCCSVARARSRAATNPSSWWTVCPWTTRTTRQRTCSAMPVDTITEMPSRI